MALPLGTRPKKSDLLRKIVEDFNGVDWGAKSPILQEFVRDTRNATIKRWDLDVAVHEVTHHRFLDPNSYLGSSRTLLWKNDEDALRLYEMALVEWHRSLCVIEQAVKERVDEPFSVIKNNQELLERSNFVETLPETPRL